MVATEEKRSNSGAAMKGALLLSGRMVDWGKESGYRSALDEVIAMRDAYRAAHPPKKGLAAKSTNELQLLIERAEERTRALKKALLERQLD